jgi:hypothetical protein
MPLAAITTGFYLRRRVAEQHSALTRIAGLPPVMGSVTKIRMAQLG